MEHLPMIRRLTTARRLTVLALMVLSVGILAYAASSSTAASGGSGETRYYLALGDSLSTGYQPTLRGQGIETRSGYVDDILRRERRELPSLQLVDLGCPGDTTTSLLTGVGNYPLAKRLECDRSGGSQLAAAIAFLRAHDHPGEVPLITLDIGINDLNRCAALANPSACLRIGQRAISTNLPRILSALRSAAPAGTTLAGMTLYDTYLGKRVGEGGTAAGAQTFLSAFREANAAISSAEADGRLRTADIAGAFDTYDTTPVTWRGRAAPSNLAHTCDLTWSCSPPPINHNIHPDARGYRVIARAFELVIGRLPESHRPGRRG
jgi:lysophospholipase L1-like esterase